MHQKYAQYVKSVTIVFTCSIALSSTYVFAKEDPTWHDTWCTGTAACNATRDAIYNAQTKHRAKIQDVEAKEAAYNEALKNTADLNNQLREASLAGADTADLEAALQASMIDAENKRVAYEQSRKNLQDAIAKDLETVPRTVQETAAEDDADDENETQSRIDDPAHLGGKKKKKDSESTDAGRPSHIISGGGEGKCGDVDSKEYVGCTKAEEAKSKYPPANWCTLAVGTESSVKSACRDFDYYEGFDHPCLPLDAQFESTALGYCPASTDEENEPPTWKDIEEETEGKGVGCNQCSVHIWVCIKGVCGPVNPGISQNGIDMLPIPFNLPGIPAKLFGHADATTKSKCHEIEMDAGNGTYGGFALGVWENICDYWEDVQLPTGAVNAMPEDTYGGAASGYVAETRLYGTYQSHDYAADAYCDQPRDPMRILHGVYGSYPVQMKFTDKSRKWRAKSRVRVFDPAPGTMTEEEAVEVGSTAGCLADHNESTTYGEEADLGAIQGFWSVSKCKGVLDPAGDPGYGWGEKPDIDNGTYCGWPWFSSVFPGWGKNEVHDGPERNLFDYLKHIYIDEEGELVTRNDRVCYDPATKDGGSDLHGVGDPTNRHNENHGWSMTDTRYYLSSQTFLYRALQGEFLEFGICEAQHNASLSATTGWCHNNVYDGIEVGGDKYRYTLLRTFGVMSGINNKGEKGFSELSQVCEADRQNLLKKSSDVGKNCQTQFCPRLYCGVDNFLTKFDNEGYWAETCMGNLSAMMSCESVDRFQCRPIFFMWDNGYDYCAVSAKSAKVSMVAGPAPDLELSEDNQADLCARGGGHDLSCKPTDRCSLKRKGDTTTTISGVEYESADAYYDAIESGEVGVECEPPENAQYICGGDSGGGAASSGFAGADGYGDQDPNRDPKTLKNDRLKQTQRGTRKNSPYHKDNKKPNDNSGSNRDPIIIGY